MAGNHLTECPGCHRRTLYVHQTEAKDVRYCQDCGFEDEVILAQPRAIVTTTLTVRDRSAGRGKENEIRRLRR